MAISASKNKTLYSSNGASYILTAAFKENSTSTSGNTSNITCTATLSSSNAGSWSSNYTSTLTIYWHDNYSNTTDRQIAQVSTKSLGLNSSITATGTINVSHKTDGSLNGYAYAYFSQGSSSGGWCPASGGVQTNTTALTTIPRYATSTQNLSSKTETTITMNWSSDNTVDYIWYSTNNGASWTGINVADGKSGSYTISGLSANTTYNIKTRVRRKDSQLTTDSSALSVTTYNYPYCTSMPNLTIGNKLTLGFYNPLGRNITVNILGADNSQISNDTTTGTSISGYNNSTVQNRFYSSIPNAKSGTYKVKVTYGSSVITKTGGTYTINTSACTPSITSVSYQDTNSTVVAITGNNQKIVRNQSIVRYTASGLTVKNSATISSCKVSVNNNNYNLAVSGTSATGGNAVINSASNVTATITLTDSRGLTATKSVTITMLDWVLPSAIITLSRQNNYYSTTYITVDAIYSSVNSQNTITIKVRYKKTTDSSWSSYITLTDNVQSTLNLDNLYDWNFQVVLTDLFGTTTYNLTLPKGMPIMFIDRLNNSVGVNCFPQDEESLEVNGFNISRSVMTRSLSAAITNLAVNTYTVVPLDLSNSIGSKLTATNDGGIKIGKGVSKVLVSGMLAFNAIQDNASRHFRIIKNPSTNNSTLAWSYQIMVQGEPENVVITPVIADVQEGDVLYMLYYTSNTNDSIGGNTYGCRTSLTVDVVG